MSQGSDEKLTQLLRATAQGDAQAFKVLYDDASPRLHAVALTMMRDPGLAEDVLQDAFVQIWHRARDYHADRGSVFTWLTTIVRYRAIDLLRKLKHDKSTGEMRSIDIEPAVIDYLDRTSPLSVISRSKRWRAEPCSVPRTYSAARESTCSAWYLITLTQVFQAFFQPL